MRVTRDISCILLRLSQIISVQFILTVRRGISKEWQKVTLKGQGLRDNAISYSDFFLLGQAVKHCSGKVSVIRLVSLFFFCGCAAEEFT